MVITSICQCRFVAAQQQLPVLNFLLLYNNNCILLYDNKYSACYCSQDFPASRQFVRLKRVYLMCVCVCVCEYKTRIRLREEIKSRGNHLTHLLSMTFSIPSPSPSCFPTAQLFSNRIISCSPTADAYLLRFY